MLRKLRINKFNFRTFSTFSKIVPNNFERFAQFVTQNPEYLNKKIKDQKEIDNKEKDKEKKLNMVALELEDEDGVFKWPSFKESVKQTAETLPHIYFHRFDEFDEIRYQHTFNCLKSADPSFVGWLGTPGIGKTTGVNYILYQMLTNLGSNGYPSVVYYRLPNETVIFSKFNKDGEIKVESEDGVELRQLSHFIKKKDLLFHNTTEIRGKSCLLLELGESENNPAIDIPTLVTVSTRLADQTLKTYIKGGMVLYLVASPTHEQIFYMEWIRYLKGSSNLWYLSDKRYVDETTKKQLLSSDNNKEEKKKLLGEVVGKMLDIVGPISRVFSNLVKYYDRSSEIENSITLVDAIDSVKDISIYNIPPSVEYYIAPYPKKKSEEDPPNTPFDAPVCKPGLYYWKFLSPIAESIVINAKLTKEQSQKLEDSSVNYLIAKSRVKKYLKNEFEDTWEWLQDVGYDHYLNKSQPANPIDFPDVNSETLPEDSFINQPVDTLSSNCLYYSHVHNFRLGDFVMVDHEKKICYNFQVTLKDLKDHSVKLSVLQDVMDRLKIVEKGYKFHLIFVIDKVIRSPSGSKFLITSTSITPQSESKKEIVTETTLFKMKSDENWKDLADHIQTTVVRALLSHDITAGLPSHGNKPKLKQTTNGFESMKVSQLRKELENYNLETKGKKKELIERLVLHLRSVK